MRRINIKPYNFERIIHNNQEYIISRSTSFLVNKSYGKWKVLKTIKDAKPMIVSGFRTKLLAKKYIMRN